MSNHAASDFLILDESCCPAGDGIHKEPAVSNPVLDRCCPAGDGTELDLTTAPNVFIFDSDPCRRHSRDELSRRKCSLSRAAAGTAPVPTGVRSPVAPENPPPLSPPPKRPRTGLSAGNPHGPSSPPASWTSSQRQSSSRSPPAFLAPPSLLLRLSPLPLLLRWGRWWWFSQGEVASLLTAYNGDHGDDGAAAAAAAAGTGAEAGCCRW